MYQPNTRAAIHRLITVGVLLLTCAGHLFADVLTIVQAEQIAVNEDYTLQALQARNRSMSELSVASQSLPDPQLKLGLANLPVDSFKLGQEPMTQTVIGVRQMFPRGDTRALSSARILEDVAQNEANALDHEYRIRLAVREVFIRIYLHQERQKILQQSLVIFSELADITRDYYATGRAHQQDVVQARLEISRVEERLSRMAQQEEEARARLAEWIGVAAYQQLGPQWPEIDQPLPEQSIVDRLSQHPSLRAWQHEILKSKTSEDIARQAYKPGFAVDLAYGGRGGRNIDGSDRSDFLSVFVTMDIPLFTSNRQDRLLASSVAQTSAIEFARDNTHRAMKARVKERSATLAREKERLELFEDSLLPQAAFNAEAAFEGYQGAVGDLTTLMRARISEYELKLGHAALRADEIITRARLLYLQGEIS